MIVLEILLGAVVLVIVAYALMIVSDLIERYAENVWQGLAVILVVAVVIFAAWIIGREVLEAVEAMEGS